MSTQRLGKGLRALIPEVESQTVSKESVAKEGDVHGISLELIEANPFQPRQYFNEEKLEELAKSITDFGLLEPVILRPKGEAYQIVAGERRVRAARIAGLTTIPALLRDYDDLEMMQVALIENLQREDLNPIEEAEGYERLIKEFSFTQNEVADAVGKKRSSVANSLRLLNLGSKERELLQEGALSMGHAKVLLSVKNEQVRTKLALRVVEEGLSVRQLEQIVKRPKNVPRRTLTMRSPELISLEEDLQRVFGTKVGVTYKRGAGKISIDYYSDEDLERILEIIKRD